MNHKRELFIIYSIMFTEILGWSLILPFLPFFVKSLNASPIYVGIILSSFSFFQFFSAPIIGKLSDKFGRKPFFIISQSATALGFLILANANSVFMIFLSRLIDGLFGSNMTLANAYITDVSKGKERLKTFGYSAIMVSLGIFVGPALGGFLATISYAIPSYLAFIFALLTLILTIVFLKETNPRKKNIKLEIDDFFPIKYFISGLRNVKLKNLFVEFFFFLLAFNLFTSTLALLGQIQFNLDTDDVGLFFLFIATVRLIFQFLVFPKLANRFRKEDLTVAGLSILIIGLGNVYFVNSISGIYFSLFMFAIGAPLSRPSILTSISNNIKDDQRGKFMGVSDSLGSISQILAPLIGAFVIENFYPGTVGLISGGLMAIALAFQLIHNKIENKKLKSSDDQ